jgi:hypothetical protein
MVVGTLGRLGAVLILTLTVLAGTAATASAGVAFEAAAYPATVSGQQVEELVIGAEGGLTVKCKSVTLSGFLSEPTEEIVEVSPTFAECTSAGIAATVAPEGCTLTLAANAKALGISCPLGKAITVTALSGTCQATIGTQAGVSSDEYTTKEGTPKTVTMKATDKGLKYTKTVDKSLCPFSGTGEKSDGTLTGSFALKATLESGAATNMFVEAAGITEICEIAASDPCASPYMIGSILQATLNGKALFEFAIKGTKTTATCTTSTIEGNTGNPLDGGLARRVTPTDYSFAACGTCTASTFVFRASALKTSGGNGVLTVQSSASGKLRPSMTVSCGGEVCEFTAGAIVGSVTGGKPATLAYSSVPLILEPATSTAGCQGPLKFSANYNFTQPKSGGVAQVWVTN